MNFKIKIIKKIDNLFGPAAVELAKLFNYRNAKEVGMPESILLIRPGGIGDAVLLIPAIINVKKKYPDVEIDILAEKRNSEIFSLCPEVSRVFHYDKPKELFALWRKKYDIVIDTEQWYRFSALFAFLTRSPVRIGFSTNSRGDLFTEKVQYDMERYEADCFLDLISPLHCNLGFNHEKSFLNIQDHIFADLRHYLDEVKAKRFVAIFPGGSRKEKIWEWQNFHQLAKMLIENGFGIIIVGGENDKKACLEVKGKLDNTVNLCGKLTLAGTVAMLKESSLLITGDSGIMHTAFATGTKTLSLFGPGNEKKWAPKGKSHSNIRADVHCRPCARFGHIKKCVNKLVCMRNITVDEVFNKAIDMLKVPQAADRYEGK